MKPFFFSFSALLVLMSFSNCANGKQIQEEPPKAVGQAFYTTWTGGVRGAGSGVNLFVPVAGDSEIKMDSVYFRGRKGLLEKDPSDPNLYVARFKTPGAAKDFVMHKDPKMEYGNEVPERIEKIPFELAEGEAVVRYTRNGKEKFFRIKDIQKKDSEEVRLKNPENIRH
ncbi:hypothetical protein JRG66_07040 [Salinimicrobium tongyeongense]|uniref:Lipoprotein n=1 Tax=Salinimicrobium tongyeongense TaxID=2809707 RepID=A0ABY6NUK7_9FLAO|nr:hypothetical protein [Salinimicrobium tongyeongense]UZH56601.1 hypothetical protein JRG66_07040 [Salinimicrobium tongyeongense]